MFRSMFPYDVFSEMDRLQRDLHNVFERGVSIRGAEGGNFPAVNVANAEEAVQIYLFAPGLDPARIEVTAEPGVLSISGERTRELPKSDERTSVHVNERFAGRFRRVLSLTDDADINQVSADYRDGVLHVRVQRTAPVQPKRIAIQ